MFSPTLVPEEILLDHPQRLRALIVEGSNPLLSFSDTQRWLEAREHLDLLVVIEPAMTETAQIADYVLPTPVGYEKWEIAGFPKGYPEICTQLRPPVVPGPPEALPEPEIYVRLAEAMQLVPPPPAELFALAAARSSRTAPPPILGTAMNAAGGSQANLLFWGYRTLGPQLPSPALTAVWAQVHANAFTRSDTLLRTLGEEWRERGPFADRPRGLPPHPRPSRGRRDRPPRSRSRARRHHRLRRQEDPPRAAADARRDRPRRAHRSPHRSAVSRWCSPPACAPSGRRTRSSAIPAWRKGRGPHCALNMSPADAAALGIAGGDRVRLVTKRGALELPAAIDKRLQPGHVWVPNGFGARYPKDGSGELETAGVNLNQITASDDRDPFTGCPMHKYTLCRVERCE